MRISEELIEQAVVQAIDVIVAMKKTGFHPVIVKSHQPVEQRVFNLLRHLLEAFGVEDVEPRRSKVEEGCHRVITWIESSNMMLPVSHRSTT